MVTDNWSILVIYKSFGFSYLSELRRKTFLSDSWSFRIDKNTSDKRFVVENSFIVGQASVIFVVDVSIDCNHSYLFWFVSRQTIRSAFNGYLILPTFVKHSSLWECPQRTSYFTIRAVLTKRGIQWWQSIHLCVVLSQRELRRKFQSHNSMRLLRAFSSRWRKSSFKSKDHTLVVFCTFLPSSQWWVFFLALIRGNLTILQWPFQSKQETFE